MWIIRSKVLKKSKKLINDTLKENNGFKERGTNNAQ